MCNLNYFLLFLIEFKHKIIIRTTVTISLASQSKQICTSTNDLEAPNFHELNPDTYCSNQSGSSIAANTDSDAFEVARLIKTVEKLKNQLKEKDEILKKIPEMCKNELKIRNIFPHLKIVSNFQRHY